MANSTLEGYPDNTAAQEKPTRNSLPDTEKVSTGPIPEEVIDEIILNTGARAVRSILAKRRQRRRRSISRGDL